RRISSGAGDDWPAVAYDGQTVVFERNEPGREARIFVAAPGAEPRPLTEAGTWAVASPVDDTVVFVVREGSASRVMRPNLAGAPRMPHFSADGKRLLVVHKKSEILELPLDGSAPPAVRWAATGDSILAADYAPDGDGFVAEIASFDGDLWLAEGKFP